MAHYDTVVHPRWLVPIIPRAAVLENYSLAVKDGVIAAIAPRAQLSDAEADHHVVLDQHALMPGLINCHGHAAMSLLRGYADDFPLMTWLQQHIWPAETEFVSPEFVRDGVELAMAELLLSGTTTFSDMYFFPDVAAECVDLSGMRAQLAFPVIDVATAWAHTADDYISRGVDLRERYRGHDRIEVCPGPHSTYTVSEATLARISALANELDAPIQIHLHETRGEVQMSVEACAERPLDRIERLGLLGPTTQCVHMTALSDEDIELVASNHSHVVHCPRSNMKLASGICRVPQLLERGINVALGTDGAASNNMLNMFAELQSMALLAKVASGEPTAIPAATALEIATINGARALGYDEHIGSLEQGKQADMIAVDLSAVSTHPIHNVLSQLVYATTGSEVTHSWVAGVPLVSERKLLTLDLHIIKQRAQRWQQTLAEFRASNQNSGEEPTSP